jgi:hypothetical protein
MQFSLALGLNGILARHVAHAYPLSSLGAIRARFS